MVVHQTSNDKEITLTLAASARIGEADELARVFREVLTGPHPLVTLDLTSLESVDVTFFQLALALQSSLGSVGRHLILRTLEPNHPVVVTASGLGLPLNRHFTLVEAQR